VPDEPYSKRLDRALKTARVEKRWRHLCLSADRDDRVDRTWIRRSLHYVLAPKEMAFPAHLLRPALLSKFCVLESVWVAWRRCCLFANELANQFVAVESVEILVGDPVCSGQEDVIDVVDVVAAERFYFRMRKDYSDPRRNQSSPFKLWIISMNSGPKLERQTSFSVFLYWHYQ